MGNDARWLIGVGAVIAALLLTVAVLLMTDSGEGPSAETTATTTTEATTTTAAGSTTAATTTSTPESTTTTAAGPVVGAGRCAGTPAPDTLPVDAVVLTALPGSFDGAPEPMSIMEADQGMVYRSGDAWWVAIGLYPTGILTAPLPEPSDPAFTPTVLSVVDFGALPDGLVVRVDRSLASGAQVYRFYFLADDCTVRWAVTAEESALEFLEWFGPAHRQGFTCVADGVHLTSAGESSGGLWDVRDRYYHWDPGGTGFDFILEDGTELAPDDPDTVNAGQVNC